MYARASAMATIYTWGVPWCQNQGFCFSFQCETLQSCEKATQLNCQNNSFLIASTCSDKLSTFSSAETNGNLSNPEKGDVG